MMMPTQVCDLQPATPVIAVVVSVLWPALAAQRLATRWPDEVAGTKRFSHSHGCLHLMGMASSPPGDSSTVLAPDSFSIAPVAGVSLPALSFRVGATLCASICPRCFSVRVVPGTRALSIACLAGVSALSPLSDLHQANGLPAVTLRAYARGTPSSGALRHCRSSVPGAPDALHRNLAAGMCGSARWPSTCGVGRTRMVSRWSSSWMS